MPHWLLKSATHRAISLLPWRQRWNEFFQARVLKSLDLSAGAVEVRLTACCKFLDDFLKLRPQNGEGFTALELGTGWYPTVPLGLYLCGAADIWTIDIDPLLRPARLKVLLDHICEFDRIGKMAKLLPRLRPERMERLRVVAREVEHSAPATMLERLNIHALVRDAQQTGLAAQSVDLLFSYSVLEYIPPPVLAGILAEFARVSTRGAVMVHEIDLFDQYARFDKSLSPLNFLRYSPRAWNLLRSPLIPLNRLRIPEYRSLIAHAGFAAIREDNEQGPPELLEGLPLAPEFRKYAADDLLVLRTWMVSQYS